MSQPATAAPLLDEAVEQLETIRDLIRWGASLFNEHRLHFGHGTDNALDEAAYLVLHALHLPPLVPESYLDCRLIRRERQVAARSLWRRVTERLPAPYITREAWFAGLPFYVDERVLIPRSPIAELIEARFEPWIDPERVVRILDLCTGSGCIAIACALAFPEAEVEAADISADALAVTEINMERHHVEGRVRPMRSDLFAGLGGSYDIIVSNPPYVSREEMTSLPEEYRREPALALEAGGDGLELVAKMLREAAGRLNPGGILVVEVGNSAEALEARFPEVGFYWLEFERGGEGVFLLTEEQLREYAPLFSA